MADTSTESRDALFLDIGQGKQFAAAVAARMKNLVTAQHHDHPQEAFVTIRGTEGVAVQLGSCCHPIPGDKIWGFMRRGHGLSVHRADCEHVTRGKQTDPQRWMPIGWQDDLPTQAMFAVPVELTVTDSRATIAAVAAALAQEGSSIVGVNMGDKAPGEIGRAHV